MKITRCIVCILLFGIFLTACKDERKIPKIEDTGKTEEELTEEVKELATAGNIENRIRTWRDSSQLHTKEITLKDPPLLDSFYAQRNFKPIWTHRALREELYHSLSKASEEGLRFEDYHGEYLNETLSRLSDLDENEKNQLELVLTDAFFLFADDLYSGKLNPTHLYNIWNIEKNEIDLIEQLEKAISNKQINVTLEELTPNHVVYSGLKKSLAEYEELAREEISVSLIEKGDIIKPGDSSKRIPVIAQRLLELDFLDEHPEDSIEIYNENLEKVIKEFQEFHGIEIDGEIGNRTVLALNTTYKERVEQIKVNLERWRWYPRDLSSHYIIVNIPNYKLTLVKDKDTIASHRTMVGTEARKTPVFSDEIEHLVYNPTWTLPPTIKKYDVIPAARKDLSYLANKDITVFDKHGQRLDPEKIDWEKREVSDYTFRQRAGGSNPLGKVKIIYPNRYAIYLHDTPSQSLFKKNARAQSSGCVRVENALDLAEYLLDDQEKYNGDTINKIINSRKTTTIKVTKNVKIHHLYWTAWRENGKTRFADDIYKLDQEVYRQLIN